MQDFYTDYLSHPLTFHIYKGKSPSKLMIVGGVVRINKKKERKIYMALY